jgi:hypothetical protein
MSGGAMPLPEGNEHEYSRMEKWKIVNNLAEKKAKKK